MIWRDELIIDQGLSCHPLRDRYAKIIQDCRSDINILYIIANPAGIFSIGKPEEKGHPVVHSPPPAMIGIDDHNCVFQCSGTSQVIEQLANISVEIQYRVIIKINHPVGVLGLSGREHLFPYLKSRTVCSKHVNMDEKRGLRLFQCRDKLVESLLFILSTGRLYHLFNRIDHRLYKKYMKQTV